jgi:TRAP-type C4-dicarboxylate transport system permease small subunit
MKIIHLIENYINKIEAFFLVLSLITMVLLAFLQVVLRNVFSTGFLWADTFLRYLVVWVGFFGAAMATKEERHISIEIFTKFVSPIKKKIVSIITSVFAVIVCYYMFVASLQFLFVSLPEDVVAFGTIPIFYFMSIIPIGFMLMLVHFIIRITTKIESIIILQNNTKGNA